MKKIISASLALLAAVTLAACANNSSSAKAKPSDSKASTSSVKKSSSKSSKSSSSSTSSSSSSSSSKVNLETPEFVLFTDEELANARTVGDFKNLYSIMTDNYIKYSKENREKFEEPSSSEFVQQTEEILKQMEANKQTFSDNLSQLGPDEQEVPADVRDTLLQDFTEKKDKLVNILKLNYMLSSNLPKDK